MKVATKTITVVRTEMTEGEWATIRQLVAEGLTVVDQVTPGMQAVAAALQLNVTPEATPVPAPPRRTKKSALPPGGDP